MLADHDFGSVSVVGRDPLVLDYQIADNAVYSDGKPVTCDDMVLAWAAQSGRFPAFDAASRAGYLDIDTVDCQPGQKKARVTYFPGRAVTDYLQLFTATSMMPSHVLGDVLGLDVTRTIQGGDPAAIDRIAQAWNSVWDLKPGLTADDLKRFPSSGAVQDRCGAARGRGGAHRQRPLVGAPSRSPSGSRCGRAVSTYKTASTAARSRWSTWPPDRRAR